MNPQRLLPNQLSFLIFEFVFRLFVLIMYFFSQKMQQGYGRREAVEHLLAMGANVLARDDGGLIPLHNACSFGHAEV